MKSILIILFSMLCFGAAAQSVQQKSDTVVTSIKLTEWQEKQLMAFEEQKKRLDEQAKLLWIAILDANKVDPEKVLKVDYKPGELVLKLKNK